MSSDRAASWPARLQLDPSVFLAPGCTVVGEVSIGARLARPAMVEISIAASVSSVDAS